MKSVFNKTRLDQALRLLGAQLADAAAPPVDLVVCGGSSLIALGLVVRSTRDVDVMAIRCADGRLTRSQPLPPAVVDGGRRVADALGLDPRWLNAGPASQIDTGFPPGMETRLHPVAYGPALTISFVDRFDLIHFKVYAATDSGPGRHANDLTTLRPSPEELLAAARWTLTQDVSEGFRMVLKDMLRKTGYETVAEQL